MGSVTACFARVAKTLSPEDREAILKPIRDEITGRISAASKADPNADANAVALEVLDGMLSGATAPSPADGASATPKEKPRGNQEIQSVPDAGDVGARSQAGQDSAPPPGDGRQRQGGQDDAKAQDGLKGQPSAPRSLREAQERRAAGRMETIPVPGDTVHWLGFSGRRSVRADLPALAQRHPEYYDSPQAVRSDIEFVLGKPDGWYIHQGNRVVLFRERMGTNAIPQARVEVEADADTMTVRSVYVGNRRQIAVKMAAKRKQLEGLGLGGQSPDSLSVAEYLAALGGGSSRPAPSSDGAPEAKASVPAPAATHQDPGEKPEAATPAVVAESLQKAAKREQVSPKQMLADALRVIDEAIARAPDNKDEAKDAPLKATINVPGDGTFKVINTKERLREFRALVERSPGFTGKNAKPRVEKAVTSGDLSPNALAREMLSDGEWLNAMEVLDAAGKPMMFGNGTDGEPIPYTDVQPLEIAGFKFFSGHAYSAKKEREAPWRVVHVKSGLAAGWGTTRADAVAQATKAMKEEKARAKVASYDTGNDSQGKPFPTQDELREAFSKKAQARQESTFAEQDRLAAIQAEMNSKERERQALYEEIMGAGQQLSSFRTAASSNEGLIRGFLNAAEKQGRAADGIKLLDDVFPESNVWARKIISDWEKASTKNALEVGYNTVKTGAPPYTMTWDEIEPSITAQVYVTRNARGEKNYRQWQEAHFETVKEAVSRGWRVPDKVLYDYPTALRSDLSDDDKDLASDAMVTTYQQTKDYGKAVQAYRDWKPGIDLKGFERTQKTRDGFVIEDGDITILVSKTKTWDGKERFQARLKNSTTSSSPNLTEQQAIDWADVLRQDMRKAAPAPSPAPAAQPKEPAHFAELRERAAAYWDGTVVPAVREYLNAYDAMGAAMMERNRIKPEGMSAREWLESWQRRKSEWDGSRKTQTTGIQGLSQKDLWPTTDGRGERLRKAMLAAIKALNGAPMTTGEMMDRAFGLKAKAASQPNPPAPRSVQDLIRAYQQADEAQERLGKARAPLDQLGPAVDAATKVRDALAERLSEESDEAFGLTAKTSDGRPLILTPSPQKKGQYQLTRFGSDGEPWGDSQYTSKSKAVDDFIREADLSTLRVGAEGREVSQQEAPKPPKAKPGEVDNFGEALPPARRAMAAKLDESLSDDDIANRPLSEIWPLAENEAIEDTFAAAVAHAARAEVPAKPRQPYKLKQWVQKVKTVRELAGMVVSGRVSRETLAEQIKGPRRALADWWSKVQLLEQIPRDRWKRVEAVEERPDAAVFREGKSVPAPMVRVRIDGQSHWLESDGTLAGTMAQINALLQTGEPEKRMEFEVRQRRSDGAIFVNKKGDPEYRELMTFPTADAARAAIKDQYDDLVGAWGAIKARDNITERDLRSAENRPRVGKDHRNGRDVTPEQFQETFGFRGGEFGKWVEQGKGDKERQSMLNGAYDALMDLADIVGVPPRAISLNGTLGIAFGSRGSGWASAHYEPSNLVINLTKTRGAGALAHEWFHALDNYFSRMRRGGEESKFTGDQAKYRTENYITHMPEPLMVRKDRGRYFPPMTSGKLEAMHAARKHQTDNYNPEKWERDPRAPEGVRPEVEQRFAALVQALDESPMTQRARMLDGKKSGDGYWSRTLERAARAFESYVIAKMHEQGYHNDFLVNVRKSDETGKAGERYPYLLAGEVKPIADAFDGLFGEIKTKVEDDRVAMFSLGNDGQFDPTNPDIRLRVDGADLAPETAQAYATASDADQRAVRRLQTSMARYIPGLRLDAVAAAGGREAGQPLQGADRARVAAAELLRALTGRRAVFFRSSGGPVVNGVHSSLAPDVLFLRHDATRPHMAVLGHEFLHGLRQDRPDLYEALRDRIRMVAPGRAAHGADLQAKRASVAQPLLDADKLEEEFLADVMGDSWMDAGFWRDLAGKEPDGPLRKAFRAAFRFISDVLGKLADMNPFGSDVYLSDVRAARKAMAQALREYVQVESVGAPEIDAESFSTDERAPWYSALERAIAAQPMRGGGASAWENAIKGLIASGKVKADEVEWSGLREWLAMQPGLITRAAVQQYLKANGVQVQETVLADNGATDLPAGMPMFSMAPRQQQTDTPEFKRWFGDSKVVDENGKPLLVYHGTPKVGFTEFDTGNVGAFFSDRFDIAASYAGRYNEVEFDADGAYADDMQGVYQAYLSLQNPMVIDWDGKDWGDGPDGLKLDDWANRAKRAGHDGLIVENVVDSGWLAPGIVEGKADGRVYVAFRPEQIKSATGNNGNFDPASPDINFSIAVDALQSNDTARRLAERAMDVIRSDSTIGVLGRTVGTPYHLAHAKNADGSLRNPDLRRVYDEAQDYLNDINTFANDPAELAPGVVPMLNKWSDARNPLRLAGEKRARLARALFEGTLGWTRDDQGNPVEAEDARGAGIEWTATELKQRYGFDDEDVGRYQQARAAIARSLDFMAAAEVARQMGGRDLPEGLRAMVSRGDTGRFRGLVTNFLTQQVDGAQWALRMLKTEHREQLAAITGPEADAKRAALKAKQAIALEVAQERLDKWQGLQRGVAKVYDRVTDLKDRGYMPLMRFGPHTVTVRDLDTKEVVFFGMYETQAEANVEARRLRESATPNETVTRGEMSQEQWRLFKGMSPETIELFGQVAGVERTPVFEEYIRRTKANHSALKRLIQRKGTPGFSEDVQRVLAAFLTSNARAAAANLHAGAMEEATLAIDQERGLVKDYATKLTQYVQNPTDEAQAIRGLMFVQFIGGSVASALVNMSQPFTMTLPYLSQHGGPGAAARLLTAGMGKALTKIDPQSALGVAMQRAEKDGIVSPQALHELQGQAVNRFGRIESGLRSLGVSTRAAEAIDSNLRRVLFAWGGFFSLAEQFNRRATFIAAYQLAQERQMADPFEFASEAVSATQGVYNRGNRPQWARGPVGATVMTFKQFSISYLEFLSRLPRREKAIALGVLMVAAGLEGLPFADDLDDLIDTIMQRLFGKAFSAKRAKVEALTAMGMSRDIAEWVLRGASASPIFPMDLAGRMSLGNMIPGTGVLRTDGAKDKSAEVLEALGPAGGVVRDALRGEFLPVAMRNAVKAAEMGRTGQYRDELGRKVADVDGVDTAAKALGFQPREIARESRGSRMEQSIVAQTRSAESEIVRLWAQGIVDNEPDKVAEARAQLDAWNERNPTARIAINRLQIARQARDMRATREDRLIRAAPKELRGRVAEELR